MRGLASAASTRLFQGWPKAAAWHGQDRIGTGHLNRGLGDLTLSKSVNKLFRLVNARKAADPV